MGPASNPSALLEATGLPPRSFLAAGQLGVPVGAAHMKPPSSENDQSLMQIPSAPHVLHPSTRPKFPSSLHNPSFRSFHHHPELALETASSSTCAPAKRDQPGSDADLFAVNPPSQTSCYLRRVRRRRSEPRPAVARGHAGKSSQLCDGLGVVLLVGAELHPSEDSTNGCHWTMRGPSQRWNCLGPIPDQCTVETLSTLGERQDSCRACSSYFNRAGLRVDFQSRTMYS